MPDGDAAASDATSTLPPGHPLADATGASSDEGETSTTSDDSSGDSSGDLEKRLRDALAEAEKWKNMSKKNEGLARNNKAAADELRRLQEASMSDTEKAVSEARRQARLEALVEMGGRVVDASLRAAAKGRLEPKSIETLLGTIDRRSFMDDEGNVDVEAITAFVESIAPPPPKGDESKDPRWPDLGQGVQGTAPLNSSDLQRALESIVGRPR